MDNVNDLVNEAMEKWDQETNGGETDPAFGGELGQEINQLVDGLSQQQVEDLLNDKAPIIFVEGKNCLTEIEAQYREPNPFFGIGQIEMLEGGANE